MTIDQLRTACVITYHRDRHAPDYAERLQEAREALDAALEADHRRRFAHRYPSPYVART